MRIVSLTEARKQRNSQISRESAPPEKRIADLERDLLHAIDSIVDLEKRLDSQSRLLRRLLKLLEKERAVD